MSTFVLLVFYLSFFLGKIDKNRRGKNILYDLSIKTHLKQMHVILKHIETHLRYMQPLLEYKKKHT